MFVIVHGLFGLSCPFLAVYGVRILHCSQQRFDQLLQDRSSGEWQAEETVGPSQPPPKDDQDIQPTTSATEDMTVVVAEEDAGPSTEGQSSPTLGPGTQAAEAEAAEVEAAVLALQQSEEEEAQGM